MGGPGLCMASRTAPGGADAAWQVLQVARLSA